MHSRSVLASLELVAVLSAAQGRLECCHPDQATLQSESEPSVTHDNKNCRSVEINEIQFHGQVGRCKADQTCWIFKCLPSQQYHRTIHEQHADNQHAWTPFMNACTT